MMSALIQGSKQPGDDIDVYLRPLVEELLQLWIGNGVRVWSEHNQEEFYLHTLLFVAINDWPALNNLSGQTNKGYHACTHCLDDTKSIYLDKCRKYVYLGHRRFLPTNINVERKEIISKARQITGRSPPCVLVITYLLWSMIYM